MQITIGNHIYPQQEEPILVVEIELENMDLKAMRKSGQLLK